MALDWLPIDPLQPPRCRLRSKADTVAPSSAASIAVPDVLMSLTFLAAQPAAPRRRRQLNVREWVGPFMDGVRPATWLPVLRPRLPLRRLARGRLGGETFDPPPSAQVVVAQRLGWTPTLLDRLPRRRLRPTEAVYVTPPVLIAGGIY